MSSGFEYLVTSPKTGHLAPIWFHDLTPEYIKEHSNGCGPAGWKIDLIPDKIADVDLTDTCNQHDVMYGHGKDEFDKRISDMCLLYNAQVDVNKHYPSVGNFVGRWKRRACREAALNYYRAVSDFGHDAFWAGKNALPK